MISNPRMHWTALAAAAALLMSIPRGVAASCAGDCDSDGTVTINEVITLVNITLAGSPVGPCAAGDVNDDGAITIDEILGAVHAVLAGCPVQTPTPVPTFVPGTCGDPTVRASEPLCALDDQTTTCDFLIQDHCLLPYPSSVFLAPDPSTPTGWRINYARQAMPVNIHKVHVDPTDWDTLDGFSPGTVIEALFPEGVDPVASGVPPITNLAHSLDGDSPTVLIEAQTGTRVVHFAELDVQAKSPATQVLAIVPGVRLRESTRYIVAIRGLKNLQGQAIAPQRAFQILRDNLATPVRTINERRQQMEDIFAKAEGAGVAREDLILAWDFVTASSQSLTGRALAMRDQGLAANGAGAPPFAITSVEGTLDQPYSDQLFRRIRGTFTVPLFLTGSKPGAMYNLGADGMPAQNGTTTAPFTVTIPLSLVRGSTPQRGRAMVYGHGLFGTGESEITVDHLQRLQSNSGFVIGATDWIGLSAADIPNTLKILSDLSNFREVPDRLQQGMLNTMLLGRLLIAADGFVSDPAFQSDGVPLIDTQELYYYGNSLGGTVSGMYMALSTDTIRGVLGVGAANFSTLLERSIDFAQMQFILESSYPNGLDRSVLLGLIQQLWDRGEPNGYTSHLISDPLPGTPAKKILLQMGVHDSQVPNIGSEIQARSLGVPAVAPSALHVFGIPEMAAPFDGSAWVPYDVSATPEPLTNTPPSFDNGVHEAVRRLDAAQRQIDAFLRPDGVVQNFCPGACVFTDVPGVH